ncbi:hypothetical protein [Amorphus sp. MBR-141]
MDVLDETALADAKLAGWYSVWLAASYEGEGDDETAIAHYKKARARLSHWLNVPLRSQADRQVESDGGKNALQRRLLEVNHHGPQALGDLVAKMRVQAKILADNGSSSNVKEEAVRMYGELLGFSATRPDNELGHGPDVVWKDDEAGTLVAFELKTEKLEPAQYTKAEVGQAHNHIQWLKDNEREVKSEGLLLIGPPGICKSEASPSDEIFLVETKALVERMQMFVAKIDDTRGRTAIDRWTLLNELGSLGEWQPNGFFRALAQKTLRSLKVG